MAINKKLIHFQTLANFNAQLSAGNILDTSIVFIKDAKKIWTHGQLYDCSEGGDAESPVYVTDFTLSEMSDTYDMEALADAVTKNKTIIIPWGGEWTGYSVVNNVTIDDDYITLFCHLNAERNPLGNHSGEVYINLDRAEGYVDELLTYYGQQLLQDGFNIKTINGESILGRGDITIQGGSGGDCLPLTGGTLTGPVVFKNGGSISVDSSDNLNLSIDETLYIDNDVKSTYGSITLDDGTFKYANGDGGYTQATGVAYKKVSNLNGGTVTLLDDIFYDFTTMISGNVRFAFGTKRGSGHYMFRFYVQSGYSVTLPNTLYFLGDEPTEENGVYEVSVYNSVTICVKIGTKNSYGGQ